MKSRIIPLILLLAFLCSFLPFERGIAQPVEIQPNPPDWIDDGSPDGMRDQPTTQDWYHLPSSAISAPQESLPAHAIIQTAAGLSHTCALTDGGGVKCWGDNWEGKLGDGTVINSNVPVDVYSLNTGVVSISATHKHTCALTNLGGVKCWGRNYHGELGDGTTEYRVTPVTPLGLDSGVAAVAAGGFHTCALMLDGTIRCWGANWHGQVGDGTDVERHTPVEVIELGAKAVAIATGKYHTCAILETGALRCWGYNKFGQLGNGPDEDKWVPTQVSGLNENVAEVALGENHSCALLVQHRVMCWGNNEQGQVGIGNTEIQYIPIFVPGMASNASRIFTGQRYSCAFAITGGVYCWGENWAGQLGDGSQENRLVPYPVDGFDTDVIHLSAGDSHSCVVLDTGGVKCWGSNSYGQLGDGSSTVRTLPVDVYGLSSGFKEVVSGGFHSCALTQAGGVYCWGSNQFGQLGDNTTVSRISPVPVYGLNQSVIEIAAGAYHTCAMTATQVLCWGNNTYGQLGSGNRYNYYVPVAVNGITHPPVAITTGSNHSCAVQDNGVVKCWGFNRNGQLGNGTRDDSTIADAIEGVDGIDFTKVSAGDRHTCAITNSGGVMCWGLNTYGQLGDGSITLSATPVQVIWLDQDALELDLGDDHSCIIVEDRSIRCWGSNIDGQLGDGTTNNEWHPVSSIGLGGPVLSLSAGGHHTCVRLNDDAVQCWGFNQSGQLGDGTTLTRLTPDYVSGLNATSVGAGFETTCAVNLLGAVKCWGINAQGQVGDNSLPWKLTPELVKSLVAPNLEINYTTGYPGSYFTLRGDNFAGNNAVIVRVNNIELNTTISSDSNGSLIFLLDSALADPGGYVIGVEAGETRNILLHIDLSAPNHPIVDDGPIYQIPGHIALTWATFLPLGVK